MKIEIPKDIIENSKKKEVEVLYIVADEDHVALQEKFNKKDKE